MGNPDRADKTDDAFMNLGICCVPCGFSRQEFAGKRMKKPGASARSQSLEWWYSFGTRIGFPLHSGVCWWVGVGTDYGFPLFPPFASHAPRIGSHFCLLSAFSARQCAGCCNYPLLGPHNNPGMGIQTHFTDEELLTKLAPTPRNWLPELGFELSHLTCCICPCGQESPWGRHSFFFLILFIYFLAALGLNWRCLLLLQSMGSRHGGFSSCGS